MPVGPYRIVPASAPDAPVIFHVPHASAVITPPARELILLDDEELAREVIRLTDWYVDEIFAWTRSLGADLFINTISRLVFDPERFADDADEPMAAVGQGVLYTRSSQGDPLREPDEARREDVIRNLYEPYHEGLSALVELRLEQFGMCFLLDCHSFATTPLPSEPDQSTPRPDICIGTDPFHTPECLARSLQRAFRAEGLVVKRDAPFSGTLVPLDYYGSDARVRSVMIEIRRGLYCDEATGQKTDRFDEFKALLDRVVTYAVTVAIAEASSEESHD